MYIYIIIIYFLIILQSKPRRKKIFTKDILKIVCQHRKGCSSLEISFFSFFFGNRGVRASLRAPQLISGLTEHPASPVSM